MPIYDFKCTKCDHVEEKYLSQRAFAETNKQINCTECGEVAIYSPSFWYTSVANAQRFSPVVIHRDAEGNIRFPAHTEAPVPLGFERVELRDIQEVRKFEREVNTKEAIRAQEHRYNQNRNLQEQIHANREVMRDLVGKFSSRGRRFYEAMREASDKKLDGFQSSKNIAPEFHLEAFSMDASNRMDYRDQENEWGKWGKRK